MKFSFEIDKLGPADVEFTAPGTPTTSTAGTEPAPTAINAGPPPALPVDEPVIQDANMGIDHRDAGPPSSELLAALAAAGASEGTGRALSTDGGGSGAAFDAGAPPSGNWGTDRSRLDFSNYGARVDAQGWGREVTTTGYGDLQGGSNPDLWYTSRFSGTSSASPIVVGALACVQGALRARGRPPLGPARARDLLRSTGSPQQDTPGRPATQRIGNRPNLRQLIAAATQTVAPWTGVQFTGQLSPRATTCWFTYNWPAHWHVVWTVIPTSPAAGAPQIRCKARVERASDAFATYWICVTNLTNAPVSIEGRYAVLGW